MGERERIGGGRWSGRGRARERRIGVHVCERERVGNEREGRQSSSRESRGWERGERE